MLSTGLLCQTPIRQNAELIHFYYTISRPTPQVNIACGPGRSPRGRPFFGLKSLPRLCYNGYTTNFREHLNGEAYI